MNEEPKVSDRIASFSYRPDDNEALLAISRFKELAKRTGKSFSFLVIKAIKESLQKMDHESERY